MKATGLIIEDDSPKSKKPAQKAANPFSFFASSGTVGKGGSADVATKDVPKKSIPAKGTPPGRAPAPYSIFDEASSPPFKPAPSSKSIKTSAGKPTAGGPSIFDDPLPQPTSAKPPSSTKRAGPTPTAAPVPQPAFFDDDGFDLMKERLAEQEKLKRKVKEQTTGAVPGAHSSSSSSSSASSTRTKGQKKENPFSFKNFATRGDEEKDMDHDDEDEDDGDDKGKGGAGRVDSVEDDSEEEEQTKPGENPFSFKAFAKKSGDGELKPKAAPPREQRSLKKEKRNPATPKLPSLSDDDDDDDDDEDEDDSVGQAVPSNTSNDRQRAKENPYSFKASPSASSVPAAAGKVASLPLPAISDSEEDEDEDVRSGIPSLPTPHAMEAGMVDVPDFSVQGDDTGRGRGMTGGGAGGDEGRLRAQIEELKALLVRSEEKADAERKRASAIERRALKAEKAQARLRKKEEEDTKQLNDVVQAIEHNLMLATARAEKAEGKVRQLEDQLTRCSCGRGSGGHGGDNSEAHQQLRTIHEQSVYLTSQLHKAANDAEAGIKNLIGGVAALRDIAAVLQGIDKMSHVPADP